MGLIKICSLCYERMKCELAPLHKFHRMCLLVAPSAVSGKVGSSSPPVSLFFVPIRFPFSFFPAFFLRFSCSVRRPIHTDAAQVN